MGQFVPDPDFAANMVQISGSRHSLQAIFRKISDDELEWLPESLR
jgi:hypothetical protein